MLLELQQQACLSAAAAPPAMQSPSTSVVLLAVPHYQRHPPHRARWGTTPQSDNLSLSRSLYRFCQHHNAHRRSRIYTHVPITSNSELGAFTDLWYNSDRQCMLLYTVGHLWYSGVAMSGEVTCPQVVSHRTRNKSKQTNKQSCVSVERTDAIHETLVQWR
jgi:hypothetical protein